MPAPLALLSSPGRPARRTLALRRPRAAALTAIGAMVGTRVLVWAVAIVAIALFGLHPGFSHSLDPASLAAPFHSTLANRLVAPAARYDSVWYLSIAGGGYASRPAAAFFPLYPLLVHGAGMVVGSPLLGGWLISLVALAGAGVLLFRLTEIELGTRAATTTLALLALFPTSLFLSAVYTESLFLLVSVGAVYAARRERWALAGLLGALASATRSAGVLVLLPLVLMYLYGPRGDGVGGRAGRAGRAAGRPRHGLSPSVCWLALVPMGLGAYLTYLGVRYGAPFAPLQVESFWGRSFAGPFGAVWVELIHLPDAVSRVIGGHQTPFGPGAPLGWQAYQLLDLPALAFAAAGLWLCARRLPAAYTAYAVVVCAQALSYPTSFEPLESFSRYLLAAFPVFMGWGPWLARRRASRRAVLGLCALGLIGFSGLWGTWCWVA